jgi:hypothetical protein
MVRQHKADMVQQPGTAQMTKTRRQPRLEATTAAHEQGELRFRFGPFLGVCALRPLF